MVRPTDHEAQRLESIRNSVLTVMRDLPIGTLDPCKAVPLGVLRSHAVRRHGATRFSQSEVVVVDLHPRLLDEAWARYARFVMYHEFLHVIGFRTHDARFRSLERLWPDMEARAFGRSFAAWLDRTRPAWAWACPSCGLRVHRRVRSNGRYRCSPCDTILMDVKLKASEPSSIRHTAAGT